MVYRRKGEPDRVALDGFSLQADNEMVALLGPNGSGKSTLMGVIAQSIRPQGGEVVSPTSRVGLSMVFQTPALDMLLTVRENLHIAGALHGIRPSDRQARVLAIAQELDIADRLDEQVRHLSGGLARRADLARALMPHPKLLLLDEPTTGLDIDARRSFWESMLRVRKQFGMTVLLATHLIDEAERADRVLMMRLGERVCFDSPDALRSRLGERVLRISAADDRDLDQLGGWVDALGYESHLVDRTVLVAHAQADLLGSCPVQTATLTLAPPSLEDVYSVLTRQGVRS